MFNKYLNYYSEEVVTTTLKTEYGNTYEITVYKNPNSINRMNDELRAVLTNDGNLYVMDFEPIAITDANTAKRFSFIHQDLLWILADKKIISEGYKSFNYKKINQSIKDLLLIVNDYGSKKDFIIGESYHLTERFESEYSDMLYDYEKMAKQKNPQYNFYLV